MENKTHISRWSGEFYDTRAELSYLRNSLIARDKAYGRIFLLIGFGFLFFSIPDFFNLSPGPQLGIIMVLRSIFLLFSLVLYFTMPGLKTSPFLFPLFTVYLTTGAFFSLGFTFLYGAGFDPSIHSFSVILVTFGLYHLLPQRMWIKNLLAISYGLGYVLIIAFWHETPALYTWAVAVYLVMVNIFSHYTATGINFLQRKEYLQREKLQALAVTDPLTGAFNRLKFNEVLEELFNKSRRYHQPFTSILFDIDKFKNINDTAGHLTGDEVLVKIVQAIQETKRETDFLARLGGDEFALLLPSTVEEDGVNLAQRISQSILEIPFNLGAPVTCSFGVAEYSSRDADFTSLILRADHELYLAKKRGGNCISAAAENSGEGKLDATAKY